MGQLVNRYLQFFELNHNKEGALAAQKSNIIVTGGTGFISPHLVSMLFGNKQL